MTTRIFQAILLLVTVLPACSEAPSGTVDAGAVTDGAVPDADLRDDVLVRVDAPLDLGTDAPMSADDAPGTDAPMVDAGMLDAGASVDAPLDPGMDAPPGSDAPPTTSSLCWNGFIDPGEACDPGSVPDGGRFPAVYSACPDCTEHLCGAGVLDTPTNRCVGGAGLVDSCGTTEEVGRLLAWDDATERNRLFTLLRGLFLSASRTEVSGQISLRRYGGITGTWYWVDDIASGAGMRVAAALPPWRERLPAAGMDCAALSLTASGAELFQLVCPGPGPDLGFCLVDPPGTPR